MNYETYFPEQRHLLPLATFRRDRLLPPDVPGVVEVARGDRVDLRTVIAHGDMPSPYMVIDAARRLRLRKAAQLDQYVLVGIGDPVSVGDMLASRDRMQKRGVRSPTNGTVVHIGDGQIIIREYSTEMTVEAGLNGQVVELRRGRGAQIEGMGAVIQAAWGNDRRGLGFLKLEPDDGLESIYSEGLDSPYQGAIVITRRPLRAVSFQVIVDQELGGVIAPSIEPALMETALLCPRPIVLTEGFGDHRMGGALYTFLTNLQGRQATIDGTRPNVLEARRPEVIVTVPINPGERPPPPRTELVLTTGTQVRLTRGSFAGNIGQVIDLPKNPITLDNGLSVFCAQVHLITGETLFVPLENLEVFG